MKTNSLFVAALAVAALPWLAMPIGGVGQAQAADAPADVDSQRMMNADRDAANWLSYGRTYSEQRYAAPRTGG